MEENENQNPEQFNISGNEKKKKNGLGPLKGILIAVIIVFLICVIGLLTRMIIVGDGDYFKPIKDIFGIEDEIDEDNKGKTKDDEYKETSSNKKNLKTTSFNSAEKYTLLSSDTQDDDVKHYRLSLNLGEIFKTLMDEIIKNKIVSPDYNYDSDVYTDTEMNKDINTKNNLPLGELESMLEMGKYFLQDMSDGIDGEMYFDVYFEENEIVQIVAGFDYANLLSNVYDYMLEKNKETLEENNISNIDEFAQYIVEELDNYFEDDKFYEMLMDLFGDEANEALNTLGIKEKDLKEMIEINNDNGILECYINGTAKLNMIISIGLNNKDFQNTLEDLSDEYNVKIDKDNIIETLIKICNKSLDEELNSKFNISFEFVEVN